ncbi:hypothetical protein TPA0907_26430 [Micromonospora humidisoli]|uniref:DUF6297 family protein n=1 Tax=Micromonospora sp. AKA109 TaxID=2733865 RepID=UPI0022C21EA2|nr:DUF6297 family protein [Micromonospora sp. AKA109]GHJ08276.1 hypothetical protein TPA0907_26430 [Micromonospora sp. AKA109]
MTSTRTSPPALATPTPRQVRARLRDARRRHHPGSLGEVLTDAYVVVLFVALYGWFAVAAIRDHLTAPQVARTDPGDRYWIAVAAVTAGAGLVWWGLRLTGPLLVTPAAQAWLVSSPVDRRAWLLPRFGALVGGGTVGGGVLAVAAAVAGGHDRPADLAWAAVAGVSCGATATGWAVVAQSARPTPRWARRLAVGLPAAGATIAVLVVLGHAAGRSLPLLPVPLTPTVGLALLPVAVASTVSAYRRLPRVDRAALTTGAQFANAATTAAVLLDPSLLAALVESRRWRAIGLVRGRPLRAGGRFAVLLQAEVRRLSRRRGALVGWAGALLTMYAVAVALPSIAGPAHLVLAYLATCRLTGGLRAVSRSAGLRRSLGGNDALLRLTHLVVPGLGATVWYLATLPALRPVPVPLDAVLLLGIVTAAFWAGTRPPMRYGGAVVNTPFAMVPVDLVRQVLRGPDLVAVLVVVQLLAG